MAATHTADGPQREPAHDSTSAEGGTTQRRAERPAGTGCSASRQERVADLLAAGGSDASADSIQDLRAQRRLLNENKRALSKALRNETRKRARLLHRSAQLTNGDLVEVLQIRQARAEAKAKAQAAPTDGE